MRAQQSPIRSVLSLDRRKSLLLSGLLILILMGLGLRWSSFLLIGIALSFLVLTAFSGRPPRSWLSAVINGVILLFLSLLLLSLLIDLEWKPRAAQLHVYRLPEASSPLVELYLPRLILAESEAASGGLRLRPEVSDPVTVTLTLPPALRFADTPDQPERSIRLSPQVPQTNFQLQGVSVMPGLWGTVAIEARVEGSSGHPSPANPRPSLWVEGWMLTALRRALNGWRGETSSIIGLAISALAGLGGLAIQMLREREGWRLLGELRRHLQDGNIPVAQGLLDQIRALGRNGYVPVDMIKRIEETLRVLEAPEPPADVEDVLRKAPWPEAAARVFLKFARALPDPRRRLLRQVIPLDGLPEPLRGEMEQLPPPLPP
ncbi:hypothetical protein, partial [Thermoflexus hugenholtzii]